MKKLTQRITGALAAACLLFGLAACGGTPATSGQESTPQPAVQTPAGATALDPQNPTTITLWHYYDGDLRIALDDLVSEFNLGAGLEAGVVVNAVPKGAIKDLEEAVTNSAKGVINSDPLPDIFFSYADVAMEIDELADLVDLRTLFTEAELAGYVDSFLEEGYIGERLVVLPIVKSTELLYMNATFWDEFCAETGYTDASLATWEGLLEAAKSYREWSGGSLMFGFDSLANFIIVGNRQLGVDIMQTGDDGEGFIQLDETALRGIFDIYWTGNVLGYFGEVGRFRSDDANTGDIIAYTGSSSGASYFPTAVVSGDATVDIEFRALAYPTFANGNAYTVQQGAGVCVVANGEAEAQASAMFLKWFTDIGPNVQISLETGYLPVTTAAYNSTELAEGLEALRAGSAAQNITAAVYEVASQEILSGMAYSAKAFNGSYSARSQLQYTLLDLVEEDLEAAGALRESGVSDEDILQQLDPDARFAEWLEGIRAGLARQNVAYSE